MKTKEDILKKKAGIYQFTNGWTFEDDQKLIKAIHEAMEEYAAQFRLSVLHSAINEIENAMERWHLARDNDNETLEEINSILFGIGCLDWFNRNDR